MAFFQPTRGYCFSVSQPRRCAMVLLASMVNLLMQGAHPHPHMLICDILLQPRIWAYSCAFA